MADLQDRMSRTVVGQVTWADPDKGMKCISCKHVRKHPSPPSNGYRKYQCRLVFSHTRKQGHPFDAEKAIACTMFQQ